MPPKIVKKGKGKQTEEKKGEKKVDPSLPAPSAQEEPPLPNPPTQESDQAPIPVPPPVVQQKHPAFEQAFEDSSVDHFGLSSHDRDKPNEGGWVSSGGWSANDGGGEAGHWGGNTGWEETAGTDTSELDYTDNGREPEIISVNGEANEKPPAVVQASATQFQSIQLNAPSTGPQSTPKQPSQIRVQSGVQARHLHSASASKGNKAPHAAQSARTSTTSMPKTGARPPLATTQARAAAHSSYFWTPNEAARAQPSTSSMTATPKAFSQPLSAWGEPKNVDPWGSPKPQLKQPPPAASSKPRQAWQDWGREAQPRRAKAKQVPSVPRGHHPHAWPHAYFNEEDQYSEQVSDEGDPGWGHASHGHPRWGHDPRKPKVTFMPTGSIHGVSTGDKPVLTPQEHSQILRSLLNDLPQSQPPHFQHQRHPQASAPHQPSHPEQLQRHLHSRSLHQPRRSYNPHDGAWHQGRQASESRDVETPQNGDYGGWHDDSGDGWNKMTQGYAQNQNGGWEDNRGSNNLPKGGWNASGGSKKASGWEQVDSWGERDNEGNEDHGWDDNEEAENNDYWEYENAQVNNDLWETTSRGKSEGERWGDKDPRVGGGGLGKANGQDGGWGRNDPRGKNGGQTKEDRSGRNNDSKNDGWDQVDSWDKTASSSQHDHRGQNDSWGMNNDPGRNDDWGKANTSSWENNYSSGQTAGWVKSDGISRHDSWGKHDDWGKNNSWRDEVDENEDDDDEWDTSARYRYVVSSEENVQRETADEKPPRNFFGALKETYWKPTTAKNKNAEPENFNFLESKLDALLLVQHAIFAGQRKARDRIHWLFSPDKDERVSNVLKWVKAKEFGLGLLGLQKFLLTSERGALFINVTFRLDKHPKQPVVDWLTFDKLQHTKDRIIQESLLTCDPASQTVVFVFLPSRSGNSVAMWRRKVPVPDNARLRFKEQIQFAKAYLRPDEDYTILVDEMLPPKKKGKKALKGMSLKQVGKQKTKQVPAKSALVKHRRSQSLSNVATGEKKRKWWQRLRFDI